MKYTSEKFIAVIGIIFSFSLLAYASTSPQKATSAVSGKYIIVLKDSVGDTGRTITEIEKKHGISAEMRYSKALKGFSASLSPIKLAKMKMDPRVAFVSEDRIVTIDGKPADAGSPPSQATEHATLPAAVTTKGEVPSDHSQATSSLPDQADDAFGAKGKPGKGGVPVPQQPAQVVPTGISRVGAINLLNKGTGVGVAVIDTGIDLTHPDLAQNIGSASKTCVTGTVTAQDDNGHGTHVSGTIAALNNSIGVVGVAPEAKLYAVKVLDKNGSGTWSSIICGIDWVTSNAQTLNIKVANMSLGGAGTSDNNCGLTNNDALHRAICNSTAQGITYVVAAGNSSADASQSVPASYDDTVIAVSALADSDGAPGGNGGGTSYGADDTFASFSNYGVPVALGAPGVNIFSTWKGGTYNTISGTSMAAPHVAGAAALYLKTNPTAIWSQVRNALRVAGEALGSGHIDPSGLHMEPVLKTSSL